MAENIDSVGEEFEMDVLIIGGRLAGENTALWVLERGFRVLIVDKSSIQGRFHQSDSEFSRFTHFCP